MTLNKTIQTFSLNVKSHSTNTTATFYELNRSLEAGFKKKKKKHKLCEGRRWKYIIYTQGCERGCDGLEMDTVHVPGSA